MGRSEEAHLINRSSLSAYPTVKQAKLINNTSILGDVQSLHSVRIKFRLSAVVDYPCDHGYGALNSSN